MVLYAFMFVSVSVLLCVWRLDMCGSVCVCMPGHACVCVRVAVSVSVGVSVVVVCACESDCAGRLTSCMTRTNIVSLSVCVRVCHACAAPQLIICVCVGGE